MIVSTRDSKDYFGKLILVPKAMGKPTRIPWSLNLTFNITIQPGLAIFSLPAPFYMNTETTEIFSGYPVTDYTRFKFKFTTGVIKPVFFGIIDLEEYFNTYGSVLNITNLVSVSKFIFYVGVIHDKLDIKLPPLNIVRFLNNTGYHESDTVTNFLYNSPNFQKIFSVPNIKAINLQTVFVVFTQFYSAPVSDILTMNMYGTYIPLVSNVKITPGGAESVVESFINYFTQINI